MLFENTIVGGFEPAFRGMRNPMNSWDKSDSGLCTGDKCYQTAKCWGPYKGKNYHDCYLTQFDKDGNIERMSMQGEYTGYVIGPNDLALAQKLIVAGPEHRKFMRQIVVWVDITAPLYWWKEFDTYKVGTVANSTSTMHKLATTPITLECFEIDDYAENSICLVGRYDNLTYKLNDTFVSDLIDWLEQLRVEYLKTKDKRYWKELIRWLPESWLQKRTVSMSYENIYSAVRQRKNHKLTEWSESFTDWAHSLPYSEELIFYGMEETA